MMNIFCVPLVVSGNILSGMDAKFPCFPKYQGKI